MTDLQHYGHWFARWLVLCLPEDEELGDAISRQEALPRSKISFVECPRFMALDVIYQEIVVHSIKNWDAEVANKQHIRRPNGLPPSCRTDRIGSRVFSKERCGGPVESARGGSRVQAQPADRSQVG
jgi:hypothetical protein